MSDFNPDALEARDVKEEYDSDPSDTGSSDDEGSGSGSEGEKEKRRKVRDERSTLSFTNIKFFSLF